MSIDIPDAVIESVARIIQRELYPPDEFGDADPPNMDDWRDPARRIADYELIFTMLDRAQVTEMRDWMTAWLEATTK